MVTRILILLEVYFSKNTFALVHFVATVITEDMKGLSKVPV